MCENIIQIGARDTNILGSQRCLVSLGMDNQYLAMAPGTGNHRHKLISTLLNYSF